MPSFLQIENISKSYGPKVLFDRIGFNVNEGDKMALVAPNGAGKTSLLRIIAGEDKSDSGGRITFLKDIRIAFLAQEYAFDPQRTILGQVLADCPDWIGDDDGRFAYELRARQLLTSLSLKDTDRLMGHLSGGETKRVALARMLASEADFFIMDEPTNHLDVDAIEFLEAWFSRSRRTLLVVSHDRYFLERVCNIFLELDHGALYTYRGDYENYLDKRQERIDLRNAEAEKIRNVLRRELQWMRSTPCARTGKAKYRKDAFYSLQERAARPLGAEAADLSEMGTGSRLGNKVFDCRGLGFRYGERWLLRDFTYNFQRYERVGIVGPNGVGKTTFLQILAGAVPPGGVLSGRIERGESLRIAWYRQEGMEFDGEQTVLETVPDSRLLGRFLFSNDMFNNPVARLSGGERRRLYLLTLLMQQPNLLILDEPTNDLDIVTLNVLEEYLLEFKGSLLIVTHDRHFLDRLVSHLLVFCGDGEVKDFIGGYTQYRTWLRDREAARKAGERRPEAAPQAAARPKPSPRKNRLSFKEEREMDELEGALERLAGEKASLEAELAGGKLVYPELEQVSQRLARIGEEMDAAELRWLELSEKEG